MCMLALLLYALCWVCVFTVYSMVVSVCVCVCEESICVNDSISVCPAFHCIMGIPFPTAFVEKRGRFSGGGGTGRYITVLSFWSSNDKGAGL